MYPRFVWRVSAPLPCGSITHGKQKWLCVSSIVLLCNLQSCAPYGVWSFIRYSHNRTPFSGPLEGITTPRSVRPTSFPRSWFAPWLCISCCACPWVLCCACFLLLRGVPVVIRNGHKKMNSLYVKQMWTTEGCRVTCLLRYYPRTTCTPPYCSCWAGGYVHVSAWASSPAAVASFRRVLVVAVVDVNAALPAGRSFVR